MILLKFQKGKTLIHQINATKSGPNHKFTNEKFEKSFQLPDFDNDDESLNVRAIPNKQNKKLIIYFNFNNYFVYFQITEDLFALHRQANLSSQNLPDSDKASSILTKKQAWTLLDS